MYHERAVSTPAQGLRACDASPCLRPAYRAFRLYARAGASCLRRTAQCCTARLISNVSTPAVGFLRLVPLLQVSQGVSSLRPRAASFIEGVSGRGGKWTRHEGLYVRVGPIPT
jgi:hypothetical protein